jgi:hypothetical protein
MAGSLAAYAGCIAGAVRKDDYLHLMEQAGFTEVRVVREDRFEFPVDEADPYARSVAKGFGVPPEAVREAAGAVSSVCVFGRKPE